MTRRELAWLSSGLALAAIMFAIALLPAPYFYEGTTQRANLALMCRIGAGVMYLLAVALAPRSGISGRSIIAMVAIAAIMRVALWNCPALSGADYNRYLWDGAVTANGVNPYKYSPHQAADGQTSNSTVAGLAAKGAAVLRQVNHDDLRTIYPPVAQGLFAGAYWLGPFQLWAWKVVLALFDILAAGVVWRLLRRAELPAATWAIYLWNPLLVVETYWSGHVDLAVAALVAAYAWALLSRRHVVAAAVLALAAGIKLWPVILVFFLIRSAWDRSRQLVAALGVFVLLLALMAIPFAAATGGQTTSGLMTYAKEMQYSPGAYWLFGLAGRGLQSLSGPLLDGRWAGRMLALTSLMAIAITVGLRPAGNVRKLCGNLALVILLMLLLGPTLWPWYCLGIIPLAALAQGRWPLLLWTATLPLCYLAEGGMSTWITALAVHVPVWVILLAQWVRPRAGALSPGEAAACSRE